MRRCQSPIDTNYLAHIIITVIYQQRSHRAYGIDFACVLMSVHFWVFARLQAILHNKNVPNIWWKWRQRKRVSQSVRACVCERARQRERERERRREGWGGIDKTRTMSIAFILDNPSHWHAY